MDTYRLGIEYLISKDFSSLVFQIHSGQPFLQQWRIPMIFPFLRRRDPARNHYMWASKKVLGVIGISDIFSIINNIGSDELPRTCTTVRLLCLPYCFCF